MQPVANIANESALEPVPEAEDIHEGGTATADGSQSKTGNSSVVLAANEKKSRDETMERLTKSQTGPFFQHVMNTPDHALSP